MWHLDGNVPILSAKHALSFFSNTALLLFVCIPYNLSCPLQKYSHARVLRWTNKLKPFIDAHTGPYKDRYQYWTGLLLLVKSGFVFLIAINSQGNLFISGTSCHDNTVWPSTYLLLEEYTNLSYSVLLSYFSWLIHCLLSLVLSLFLLEIFSCGGQQESYWIITGLAFVNPQRMCHRVTVHGCFVCVCVSICYHEILVYTLKTRCHRTH